MKMDVIFVEKMIKAWKRLVIKGAVALGTAMFVIIFGLLLLMSPVIAFMMILAPGLLYEYFVGEDPLVSWLIIGVFWIFVCGAPFLFSFILKLYRRAAPYYSITLWLKMDEDDHWQFHYLPIGFTKRKFEIGSYHKWQGKVCRIGYYNRPLSDDQVNAIEQGVDPREICPDNLVAYYPLTPIENVGSNDMVIH